MMILICDYDIMVSKEAIDNDKEDFAVHIVDSTQGFL